MQGERGRTVTVVVVIALPTNGQPSRGPQSLGQFVTGLIGIALEIGEASRDGTAQLVPDCLVPFPQLPPPSV